MRLTNKWIKGYGLKLLMFIPFILVNNASGQEAIVPIQPDSILVYPQEKITLGAQLFKENRLSFEDKFSCQSCHPLNKYGADGLAFSEGYEGTPLDYNTPSIHYVAYNQYVGWAGNTPNLRLHLNTLIQNPKVMNTTWSNIINQLEKDKNYQHLFKQAGYENINADTISDAIITFEKSLATASRFDLYLLGDKKQLNAQEVKGYQLFKEYGCIACHQGINIGGNMRQTFGAMQKYYDQNRTHSRRDLGYFNTSKDEQDKFLFRVPSLRNVAQTAPYFHDASETSLRSAIKVMFKYQLGLLPSEEEVIAIESFLQTLDAL